MADCDSQSQFDRALASTRRGGRSSKKKRVVTSEQTQISHHARVPTCHNHARKADSSTRDDADDTSPSSYKTMASFPLDTSTETGVTSAGGFLSLPRDVISHILRSEFLPEPKDLGRLRAVCKGLRDAVDLTGRKIKKMSDELAVEGGYLSLLKDRHSRGVLKYKHLVCAAAARNGDLKELKALRADDYPWDTRTCAYAAKGGHLETLKWARENHCPWDKRTCAYAAKGGHLEVLKWARANGCPWDENSRQLATEQWPEVFA